MLADVVEIVTYETVSVKRFRGTRPGIASEYRTMLDEIPAAPCVGLKAVVCQDHWDEAGGEEGNRAQEYSKELHSVSRIGKKGM